MEIRIEKNMDSEMETGNYIGDCGSYSLNCRSENMVHSRPSRQTNGPKPLNIVKQVSILQRTVHNGGLGKLFTSFIHQVSLAALEKKSIHFQFSYAELYAYVTS